MFSKFPISLNLKSADIPFPLNVVLSLTYIKTEGEGKSYIMPQSDISHKDNFRDSVLQVFSDLPSANYCHYVHRYFIYVLQNRRRNSVGSQFL